MWSSNPNFKFRFLCRRNGSHFICDPASRVSSSLGNTAPPVGDSNVFGSSGRLILDGDTQDIAGVDVEGDLDLGDATGSGGKIGDLESSDERVVFSAGTIALVHQDGEAGLVVGVGGEYF